MLKISTPPNTNYTHDIDNRMLTAGGATFGYDNNGNLVTKTVGRNVTNYSWDYNDMLIQVVAGGDTHIYRYDGLGNRIARIENGVEKRYVGGLAETDSSGNITAYYVYGLGLISKITPSNQAYYYHYDGIGSTIGMSDSSGNVVNKYAYDAFGGVLNEEEAIPNAFKYVGQFGVMDEGNGLLYMRARYYDPEVGRFISKDPIGFAGGDLNLYAYVRNNPVNYIDPSGTAVIAIPIAVLGGRALLAAGTAYLYTPQGQEALRSFFKTIEDLIREIDEAKEKAKSYRCETQEPWQGPGGKWDPNKPPDGPWWMKLAWALGQVARLIKGWPD